MKRRNYFIANNLNEDKFYLDYEDVDCCPLCKSSISPIYIASSLDDSNRASVFFYCRSCKNTFITRYSVKKNIDSLSKYYYQMNHILCSEPDRFSEHIFDENISSLSPQFCKIYNQALAAESSQLDEIAGLGYRKALEFLIKDFAIHKNPNDEDKIKSMPLAQCIKNFIDNDNIKTLAERSAWIGNDEAHYIRKQEERDVSDMKNFIKAIVYFIGMILITEDASTMEPK